MNVHKPNPLDVSPVMTDDGRALARVWNRWRGGRLTPTAADIVRSELSPLADKFFVLAWRAPEEVVFEEAGARICEVLGDDVAGRNYIAYVRDELKARQIRRLARQVVQPCGAWAINLVSAGPRFLVPVESVTLPLSPADDDGEVVRLIGVSVPMIGNAVFDTGAEETLAQVAKAYRYLDIGAGVPNEI